MSLDSDIKIIIYGTTDINFQNIKASYPTFNSEFVILTNETPESKILANHLFDSPELMFINADTMKQNKILGNNFLRLVINKIIPISEQKNNDSYVILFNRYLDSSVNTIHLQDFDSTSEISIFQSFNPGNSDAYYLSKKCVEFLRNKFPNPQMINNDIKTALFDFIHEGHIDCYSFNPNLYFFRLEKSSSDLVEQYYKSSIIAYDNIMEARRLGRNISIFLSDHAVLFWIFIIFFICSLLLIYLRIFKIGADYFY